MKSRQTAVPFLLLITTLLIACNSPSSEKSSNKPGEMWFDGKPLYEIYTRSFSEKGTLDALEQRLPELKELGIDNIWLMPIQSIGELGRKGSMGSPYSIRDYYAINEEYGTMDDFRNLVRRAHSLEMHLILDVVFNHSANDHVEMREHPNWFAHDSLGNFTREVADWSDITDWNFQEPEVQRYLVRVLQYYVRDVGVDGFRCDVAGMVPSEFWNYATGAVKSLKPDVLFLAEWEDPAMFNQGFDATYDWTLYHRMKAYSEGTITLDSLWKVIDSWDEKNPENGTPLRFVENHDEQRSASVFGWPGVRPYAALVFTLPGIPLIYNGQEVGATHKPSLFEKEPINWNSENADSVRSFYRELVIARNEQEALQTGSLERLEVDTEENVLVFQRTGEKQVVTVALNFGDHPVAVVAGPDLILNVDAHHYDMEIRNR